MLQRYGGNLDCRELRAGATLILPVAHDGAGLYFGDCKALMGDGEIVGPPEVRRSVTASAVPLERPLSLEWPRIETTEEPDHGRLRQTARVERATGVPRTPQLDRGRLRPAARAGGSVVGDGRARADRTSEDGAARHGLLRRPTRRLRALRPLANKPASRDADHMVDDAVAPASTPSWRFMQPQAWFGTICRWSPTAGRPSSFETSM